MYERKEIDVSRRTFLAGSVAGLALAGLPEWVAADAIAAEHERAVAAPRRIGQNDQINFGAIGLGGSRGGFRQGLSDTRGAAGQRGCKVVAVSDVDQLHLDEGAAVFGSDTAKYKDYRDLLSRTDVDAVVIGTPDHWHTIIAIAAMRAGKDVYCEKPLTLTIDEGKKLVKVAKQTGRIFQVGSQQRSDARFRMACELVRNNRLGKIKRVQTNLPTGPAGGPFPVTPVPEGFDWDVWQGQTPAVDYVKERTHGSFRHWLEYSGGMMTDWGAHHNDIMQWGLGMDGSGPIAVEAVGVRHFGQSCYNAFQEFAVTYTYPGGITVLCTDKGENGVQFEGENGWIFVSRGVIRASEQRLLDEPLPASATKLYASNNHMGNFVDCVRSRKQPICTAEIGHRSVSVCHLGNISMRLAGRRLKWDPKAEMFVNDAEANAMLIRAMRKPYALTV